MGCTTCEAARSHRVTTPLRVQTEQVVSDECPFTNELLDSWLTKVQCAYDTALYIIMPSITKKQLISYKGTLLSAKNYTNNKPCYFKNELEEIEVFITVLIAQNLCNT